MTDRTQPASESADVDLYCLECGYNLRGLSGDPRRCPECGHLNPVGDLEIPAPLIKEQLRKMESAPANCVLAVLFGVPWIYVCAAAVMNMRTYELGGLACVGVPLLVVVAVWLYGFRRFRSSCENRPGWLKLFLEYHLYALILCIAVGGLVIASSFIGRQGEYMLPGFGAAILVLFLVGGYAHRRLRAKMEPMQRDVAVKLAQDALRSRLQRRLKKLPFGPE